MDQFYNGTRSCPCRPACLEENYPASVSSVKWPNEKHQVDQPLRTSLVFPKETAANAFGMEIESVRENLVKINVYYTSLNEKTIEDEIVYSVKVREFELKSEVSFFFNQQDGSLFSALGGCLSLWLGVSFCNLFEILELAFDFIGNIVNRIAGRAIGRATNPL